MLSLINRFCIDERGASAIEYAMLAVFVALGIAVAAQTLGQNISTLFTSVGTSLTTIAGSLPTP